MKTLKAWAMALLFTAGLGWASAQSLGSPLAVPQDIRNAVYSTENFEEVMAAFDAFKQQQAQAKTDLYLVLYAEADFYLSAIKELDGRKPEALKQAQAKYEEAYRQILKKYSTRPGAYLLQIDYKGSAQDMVDLATKALAATPMHKEIEIRAYQIRGEGYSRLGKTQEAQADFAKAAELQRQ